MRRRAGRRRLATVVAVAFLGGVVLLALAAPLVVQSPTKQDLLNRYGDPGPGHLLGTDEAGRDVASRLVHGARISLRAGVHALLVAGVLGVTFGLVAGYQRGLVDQVMSRVNDALMSLPGIVLAMAFIAVLGPGITNAMTAVGIIFVPRFYRVTRAAARSVRESLFVEGLIMMGCRTRRIMVRHVLPNIASPIIVEATTVLSAAILAEASLSFLGLGVEPPAPSWGSMLSSAQQRPSATHMIYPPGIALSLTLLAVAVLGDGLRNRLSRTARTSAP